MTHQDDTESPQPVAEEHSLVGGASTALFAIFDQIESWAEWHCDPDADIGDPSPEDMHAHTNGLIMQACAKAKDILANDQRVAPATEADARNQKDQ